MANPKPQTEREGTSSVWSFLDRNWQIAAVILAVIAIFVWYQALNLGTSVQKALDDVSQGIKDTTSNITPGDTVKPTASTPLAVTPPAVRPAAQYKEVAKQGQGLTHLARQALQNYLINEKPKITLTRERKIYIEDYLKDQRVAQVGTLHPGQELSFSADLIKEGIERAQQLTSGQLNNLTKYANRVSGLAAYAAP